MIGHTLSQYKILEQLGDGGMGVVYKARDTRLNRFAALKILRADKIANSESKRRFVQEAHAASALNHPNIVTIYDINCEDGVDYIAMEFVRGETLQERIAAKRLSLSDTLKFAVQISDGLAAAHAAGIIHRDMKPTNVMVTEHGLIKILDFGLAKLVDPGSLEPTPVDSETGSTVVDLRQGAPETEEGTIMGTLAYMSPEQAEGKKMDSRSDIFSFGSMLYEMITGQRPFQGETKVSTLTKIIRDEPRSLRELVDTSPPEMERIISRCMRKDPDRRFQHMIDAKIALDELRQESESGSLRPASSASPTPSSPPLPIVRRKSRWLLPVAILGTLLLAGALWLLRPGRVAPEQPLVAVPFTTYSGSETEPSFSPDGNQVAFTWTGEKDDNSDIYVKLIGTGTPLRLTKDPRTEYGPAWSPDGRSIAFLRTTVTSTEVVLIPALGGPERQLGDIGSGKMAINGPKLAWSPDGKWLATVRIKKLDSPIGLLLMSVETGEKRTLTTPPKQILGDGSPAFSPDGSRLVFSRNVMTTVADLYQLDLTEGMVPKGEPKRLTFENSWTPSSAWTPDGREIIFSTGQFGSLNLLRMPAAGSRKPVRLSSVGEGGGHPAISQNGRRLVYQKDTTDIDIWRAEVPAANSRATPPVKLISSTRMEHTPSYSPDGKRIAYSSNRSGSFEIWVCDADGSNSNQLTSFGGPFTRSPSWSPDGAWIAFDSRAELQPDIYVISSQGGKPRRLTKDPSNEINPIWSKDGKFIYFASNRGGNYQLWKSPAAGGDSIQITKSGSGYSHAESPDGQFLYYLGPDSGLWKVRIQDREESQVIKNFSSENFKLGSSGVYFTSVKGSEIEFLSFATGQTQRIATLDKRTHMGFSLSPDERWLLFTQIDQRGSDLMLVENFR